MSAEDESKSTAGDAARSEPGTGANPSQPGRAEEHHALGAQAQRDEEIEAIQQHSRHQHPGIDKPPEVPPIVPLSVPAAPEPAANSSVPLPPDTSPVKTAPGATTT